MKITNVDSFIEEFRNGRDIWSRTVIELAVREIEQLRKENHKLKVRLEASENHLVLMEINEMLKKTQARVQELEMFQDLVNRWSDQYYRDTNKLKQRIAELEQERGKVHNFIMSIKRWLYKNKGMPEPLWSDDIDEILALFESQSPSEEE